MIRYIETKSILSKLRQRDSWFGITYNMNLYRGCQHGCIYCDTRSECYGIGDISRILVKQNALELLPVELHAKRKKKGTVGTGSMNDPYMPLEKEVGITRKALQILAEHRFPIHIITKSDLVVRDKDLLRELSRLYAAVSFTITTTEDSLSQKTEPYAPLSSARFKAMEELAKEGIYTGVTLMPLLPYLNDTKENLETVLRRAKDAGASYVLPMFGVTLRKGSRDHFYQALDHAFPTIRLLYEKQYGDQYECMSPHAPALYELFREQTSKLGLEHRIRTYEPPQNKQLTLF